MSSQYWGVAKYFFEVNNYISGFADLSNFIHSFSHLKGQRDKHSIRLKSLQNNYLLVLSMHILGRLLHFWGWRVVKDLILKNYCVLAVWKRRSYAKKIRVMISLRRNISPILRRRRQMAAILTPWLPSARVAKATRQLFVCGHEPKTKELLELLLFLFTIWFISSLK